MASGLRSAGGAASLLLSSRCECVAWVGCACERTCAGVSLRGRVVALFRV